MPSKNQLSSNSPAQSNYGLSGLFTSILKMVKVSNECKILCVLKKVTLSKNVVFSFKSVDTKMLKLLRSGDEGALLQFMKKVKETSMPALGWEIYWQRVESVEWCPALICQASMIKRGCYILVFC